MSGAPVLHTIRVERAFGPVVEGEAVVSAEGFSPQTYTRPITHVR